MDSACIPIHDQMPKLSVTRMLQCTFFGMDVWEGAKENIYMFMESCHEIQLLTVRKGRKLQNGTHPNTVKESCTSQEGSAMPHLNQRKWEVGNSLEKAEELS